MQYTTNHHDRIREQYTRQLHLSGNLQSLMVRYLCSKVENDGGAHRTKTSRHDLLRGSRRRGQITIPSGTNKQASKQTYAQSPQLFFPLHHRFTLTKTNHQTIGANSA